jgi:transcriptional regulator with XRE-family HTH domain
MMNERKPTYKKMLRELTETHGLRMELIATDTEVSIAALYRIKRGQEPRTLAAQKSIERYYNRIVRKDEGSEAR